MTCLCGSCSERWWGRRASCRIADLQDLLQDQSRVLGVVEDEAQQLADKFGRPRRSIISAATDGEVSPPAIVRESGSSCGYDCIQPWRAITCRLPGNLQRINAAR